MSIRIYNTLTHKKEPFSPIEPGHVKLYVCGITSYDYCHIGHARSSLAFDMIVKYFKYRGFKVTFVRNFTDIDDKIIARAHEQGTAPELLAETFIQEFYQDMDYLGLDRADIEPKATEHIPEMIELIETLIAKDFAYASEGDVYFKVTSFDEYGKLSGRNIEDMQAGARISVSDKKSHPMDFVLWKASKPGEPAWDSPWGPGRPGWHIECSAMSKKYFGDTFDIHGGGKDLIFPHHENEIAQSECASGKNFVNMWIHHGFVTVRNEDTEENEKMSKSLGNFLTIRALSERFHPEVLKLFVFSTQYRNPLEYSEQAMQDTEAGLSRLYECLDTYNNLKAEIIPDHSNVIGKKDQSKLAGFEERFIQAMDNDFNSAQAIGILFETAKTINKILGTNPQKISTEEHRLLAECINSLRSAAEVMGLLRENPTEFLAKQKAAFLAAQNISEDEIDELIEQRYTARKEQDWTRSDQIRDKLLSYGIDLKDNPSGTTWTMKRDGV